MKRSFAGFAFGVVVLALAGCMSPEVQRQAILNEARCQRFVDLMQKGQTSRDQERGFILENQRAWAAFRSALGLESAVGERRVRERRGLISAVLGIAVSAVPRLWVSIPLLEPRVEVTGRAN